MTRRPRRPVRRAAVVSQRTGGTSSNHSDRRPGRVGVRGGPVGRYGELFDSTTPAGEVATVTHFGPYAHLGDAHAAIRKWCAANQRTAAGPNWEVYGHWLPEWNEDASRIRTDVFYLLTS